MTYPFNLKKNRLHERLKIPAGERIPLSRLHKEKKKAQHEHDLTGEREIQFALNARHFRHHNRHSDQ